MEIPLRPRAKAVIAPEMPPCVSFQSEPLPLVHEPPVLSSIHVSFSSYEGQPSFGVSLLLVCELLGS